MKTSKQSVLFFLMFIFAATPVRAVSVDILPKATYQAGPPVSAELKLPSGERITARLALSQLEKKRGLSGFSENDFAHDEALLIVNKTDTERKVWMVDTRFNLDVFFLDSDLTVIDIERNLQAHPGKQSPPDIQISKGVTCRHILEMRADSKIAGKITKGMVLRWVSIPALSDIIRERTIPTR